MSHVLPIFPLGSVVLPGTGLPLHIFEARYRALMQDLTEGRLDPAQFGVVLIERGSEVGGGDARTGVGTVVSLLGHEQLPDGRWVAVAGGHDRFRVLQWLPDNPYPRAEVEILTEESWTRDDDAVLAEADQQVRRAIALAVKLGLTDADVDFPRLGDPIAAVWQLAALAPLGSFDRQAIIESATPGERARLLVRLAADASDSLAFRLGGE